MQGKGPTWGGRPKRLNVVLFSDDPVAVDAVGARIMGISPKSVPHLVACHNRGIGTKDNIEIVGEDLNRVRLTFEVPDRYTYYSCRTGLMMQRVAKRFDQLGKWMIEAQWKRSKPVVFVARGLRRISKKGLKG
jgi:hypothetical protein